MTLPYLDTLERWMLDAFVKAADAHERAPTRRQLDVIVKGDAARMLARMRNKGVVESRVYGRNFRVIVIKKGMHTGKHTKLPPKHWQEHVSSLKRRGQLYGRARVDRATKQASS